MQETNSKTRNNYLRTPESEQKLTDFSRKLKLEEKYWHWVSHWFGFGPEGGPCSQYRERQLKL